MAVFGLSSVTTIHIFGVWYMSSRTTKQMLTQTRITVTIKCCAIAMNNSKVKASIVRP